MIALPKFQLYQWQFCIHGKDFVEMNEELRQQFSTLSLFPVMFTTNALEIKINLQGNKYDVSFVCRNLFVFYREQRIRP